MNEWQKAFQKVMKEALENTNKAIEKALLESMQAPPKINVFEAFIQTLDFDKPLDDKSHE